MKRIAQNGSTSAPTRHASHVVAAKPSASWERDLMVFHMVRRVFDVVESSETASSVRKGHGGDQRRKGKEVRPILFWCYSSIQRARIETNSYKAGSPEEVDLESSPKTPQPHTTSVGRVSEMRNSRDAFATPCPRPQDDGVATDARGISSEDGPSHKRRRSASSLGTSMMRTVVTSGNDALNILFEAAASHRPDLEQPNPSEDTLSSRSQTTRDEDVSAPHERHPGNSRWTETHTAWPVHVSQASRKVLGVWEACRFVKMGWLTSREAVTLIDLYAVP